MKVAMHISYKLEPSLATCYLPIVILAVTYDGDVESPNTTWSGLSFPLITITSIIIEDILYSLCIL